VRAPCDGVGIVVAQLIHHRVIRRFGGTSPLLPLT
jgi:hypothetical protein